MVFGVKVERMLSQREVGEKARSVGWAQLLLLKTEKQR